MPRNGGGIFALPEPPFIPNTVISSSAVNSDFSDIADALTGSLARDGQGGMTGPLLLASQGMTYLSDPNTGVRRSAADTQEIFGGGLVQATIGPTGADFAVPLKQGGGRVIPIGMVSLHSGSTAPPLWLLAGATYLRATYPDLWTFAQAEIALGNTFYSNGDGSTTFTIAAMTGIVPAGIDPTGAITPGLATMGALTGAATRPIAQTNLPAVAPTFTGINAGISVNSLNNQVAINAGTSFSFGAGGLGALTGNVASPLQSTGTFTPAGTISPLGSGTPFNIVQPSKAFNFIVFAGA